MTTTKKRLKRSEVPVEQTWDLRDLFTSEHDWEEALTTIQSTADQITPFKGKVTDNAATLTACLKQLEELQARIIRIATYANLKLSGDGSDPQNQANSAKTASVLATIGAKLSFIDSELLTLSQHTIDQYLQEEPQLKTYGKMLEDKLERKAYTLAPEIEEILAALSEVHDAPYMIYERSKSSDMAFAPIKDQNGNELPMSAALYEDRYEITADTDIRRNAYDSFIQTLNRYKNTYAATYATEVNKHVTMARLRGYGSATEMLLHEQQVTPDMYNNQLDIIQQELAPSMRRFVKLKQQDLGLMEMRFCDLKAPLDPSFNPKTTYEEATATIIEALQIMGPAYSDMIETAVRDRWIDRADNVGKATGAFCSSPYGTHPYILLTWTDMMRGTFLLAHELGHAGHFYLAHKEQSLVNTRPSTYFIEAPSTLNELLLGNHLLHKTDDKRMRRWVISQMLGTYYHNFITHLLEGEFQRRIYTLADAGTPITADVLCNQKKEAIVNFWGKDVTIDDGAGLTWMRQPHYYMGLYPYTYSAGLTVSTTVAQMIQQEGKPAVDRWLNVLKSGGTMKPLELIKQAGVDMENPDTIRSAVAYVGKLVDELEKSYA
ncbi:oligoendopeptidase F [Lentibacillus sp. L22]|uniref:oligoendopeptidase F n=1 Tax=Lentibacillus sp. L22 TaxID=3163028 RepID=UPI00346635D8